MVDACRKNGGFYLASIGGIAGTIAQECFKSIEMLEYPELGTFISILQNVNEDEDFL